MSLELETRHKDWKNLLLKDCIIGKGSYGANVAALNFDPLLPRYLRITDIDEQGNLITHNAKSINLADAKSYYLEKGDIVFARTGSVGKTYLHKSNEVMAYASYLIRFRPNQKIILPEYLFLFTQSNEYRIWIKKILRSGVQSNINAEEYSNLPILIPPLPEQQKIANILRVRDNAIEKVSVLISLYEQFFNNSLAELLKNCLNLQCSNWHTIKLGEIFTERQETTLNKVELLSITRAEGIVKKDSLKKRDTLSKDKSKYLVIYPGDIGYNTMRMWQGVCGISSLYGIISPAYTICIPDNPIINPNLFTFYLNYQK
ncbi:MAG: restriction endonuclease subunit S [Rickettsia endosymbiont of Glossina mortisans submortisans]|nr:restriction endonuclease subunit S [Rickettsia endosymbiont of Glossina mortisans submortisans]